jgi:hypothetical protein
MTPRQDPSAGSGQAQPVGERSFWTTLPGILTGLAAVVTAVATLLGVLYASGVIGRKSGEPTARPTSAPPPAAGEPPKEAAPPPVAPTGFRVVELVLRADPFDYVGSCPVQITFSGRVSVAGGAGTVAYKFLRSDGASAPVQTLTFEGPGSQDIQDTWTLGTAGFQFNGWESVEILDPENLVSNRAEFKLSCT